VQLREAETGAIPDKVDSDGDKIDDKDGDKTDDRADDKNGDKGGDTDGDKDDGKNNSEGDNQDDGKNNSEGDDQDDDKKNSESKETSAVEIDAESKDAKTDAAKSSSEQQRDVEETVSDVSEDEVRTMRLAALNNLALCRYKCGQHSVAERCASAALQLDPKNTKSLFYRGRARAQLNRLDAARDDLAAALAAQPDNQSVRIELQKITKRLESEQAHEKKVYGAMFGGKHSNSATTQPRTAAASSN